MTSSEWRRHLKAIGAQATNEEPILGDEVVASLEHAPTPAAVLVTIILGEQPSVLLTKRTAHLKRHAGQISFPGGRIDPEDASPEAAALREAHEEVGLPPDAVELCGRLTSHITGTGYRITPILAVLPEALTWQLSPHEVEEIFELPMRVVLDPKAPKRERRRVGNNWREFWVWPHHTHYIWGATAAILVQLAQRLRQQGVTCDV